MIKLDRSLPEVQGVIKTRLKRILGIPAIRSAQFNFKLLLKTKRNAFLISLHDGDFQRSRKRSAQARSFFQAWSLGVLNTTPILHYFGPRSWRTHTATYPNNHTLLVLYGPYLRFLSSALQFLITIIQL